MTDAQRWMPATLRLYNLRRMLLVWVMALMVVQTVGVLHRVAHVQQSSGLPTHAVRDTSGVWAAMWGEHSNAAECQLFDHACPDLLQMVTWVFPATWPLANWLSVLLQERFALFERFYAARGPPVVLI